ncbi:EGF-like domain protein, partial [Ostertagia ostertagi]
KIFNGATYEKRQNCAFEWVTQPFSCPKDRSVGDEFMISHVGEDEYGYSFQRLTIAHCNQPGCSNGGVLYNGTCVCTEYWTGKFCTVPICMNGGSLSDTETECICPKGFSGPNCQFGNRFFSIGTKSRSAALEKL